jgi:hypothetical protein
VSAYILSKGSRAGAPGWYGRDAYLDDVERAILSLDGSMRLRARHVSAHAVYAVAMHDARTANPSSGGDVATAHDTVARALRISRSTVERARRWLRESGLVVVVETGRYLTTAERRAAGNGQKRAASTRALVHPPGRRRARRRRPRDVLRPEGSLLQAGPVDNRSPSRVVDNFPRPIWAQRLAAGVDYALRRRGRRVIAHRHVGSLVGSLVGAGIPLDTDPVELVELVHRLATPTPSDPIRDELAWFGYQLRQIVDDLWRSHDRRAAGAHRHNFRALQPDGRLGCLGCQATKERDHDR